MSFAGTTPTVALFPATVPRARPLLGAAGLAWLALAAYVLRAPDVQDLERTTLFGGVAAAIGLAALAAWLFGRSVKALSGVGTLAPWLLFAAIWLAAWEAATAKSGYLPLPFFAAPQALLEVYTDDWPRLLDSLWHSLWLLARGYAIGATIGFVLGVGLGRSRAVSYWASRLLRLIGPLPATAWVPLAFFVFPTSASASTFLIALATGFPVAVLTWSGVASVAGAYYDVARTLGAGRWFLVWRVAIPAALPHVFVGLFMGLGASFAVLVVAEMLGVKSGLGWYLQWAQGWAAYANMYAALLLMAAMCSALITLLFRLRDRLLAWQKGMVQW